MEGKKEKLISLLNQALELEHAARIQYLAHAQAVKGEVAEKIIERLEEIAADEAKHEGRFRNLIGSYLGAEPSMGLAKTMKAKGTKQVLEVNLKNEKEAIDFYKAIYEFAVDNKSDFPYSFETIEHELRHVILDEQEHVTELSLLLGI